MSQALLAICNILQNSNTFNMSRETVLVMPFSDEKVRQFSGFPPTSVSFFCGSRGLRPDLPSPFGRKFQFCLTRATPFRSFTWAGFFEKHLHAWPKAVSPHFLQRTLSLPMVLSFGTRLEMKAHAHDILDTRPKPSNLIGSWAMNN